MIIGNPATFAIESAITQAYVEPGLRALGLFVLHIADGRFGVYSAEASMLANSFDEVARRVTDRGRHTAMFSAEPDAAAIANAISRALYLDCPKDERFFGYYERDFVQVIHSNRLVWAPDGDAAFDDGSHVLHFDIERRVRLIAFKRGATGLPDSSTLVDVLLPAGSFYEILTEWYNAFRNEWQSMPKTK